MTYKKIKELVSQMTLEEKAGMLSGADFWHTKGIERLGIPQSMVSDGPHGLRKQAQAQDHLGMNASIKAVCFPAGCASTSSFDRDLLYLQGEHIGKECQAENLSVVLGPAMNIKRSPLCGRNFEYLSEDPFVTGEMSAAFINGVQSQNVGTSPKHFALNNQESRRMSVSAEVDERTMREIYLAGFERMVKQSKPWTIMCSYNRINGVYAAENHWLLTEVLRDEWGFDGYVVSDWGAANERIGDVIAGLDLEMPGNGGINDRRVIQAVKDGGLEESEVDKCVERILDIVFRYTENKKDGVTFDYENDHALAQHVEEQSIVLLKNDAVLPLAETDTVVFIGKYAKSPRYQGGGSSHINSFRVTSAVEAATDMKNVSFAQGYDDADDVIDEVLEKEAVEAAKAAKAAVIFAGLPDSFESEGYDRTHMRMPDNQNHLIAEIAKIQPNTIVVLHNGSPVEMPWIDDVAAVLECYLGGQAVGGAQVSILFGKVNPSGKLAETFPLKLEDNPSYLNFPGEKDIVRYQEGVFVGYRYYDTKKQDVLFPFGHGLSYTTFGYSNLILDKSAMKDSETLRVTVDVTNTGACTGKEVVQLYVAPKGGMIIRPMKELKGFEKTELAPGETKTVTFTLDKRAFASWNEKLNDWYAESGEYDILIGSSSCDIRLSGTVRVESTIVLPVKVTVNTTFGDLMEDPVLAEHASKIMEELTITFGGGAADDSVITPKMVAAMLKDMPLRAAMLFSGGKISYEDLCKLIKNLNQVKTEKPLN